MLSKRQKKEIDELVKEFKVDTSNDLAWRIASTVSGLPTPQKLGEGVEYAKCVMGKAEEFEKNCERIDAAMFSGDTFLDKKNRTALRDYMARWERELNRQEELEEVV